MNLSIIQYDVIMMAINEAQNAIIDDTLLDPYAENPNGYTNETLAIALNEVKDKIINANIPT